MMKILLTCLALLSLGSWSAVVQAPAEPGHFDYYLLNISWSPEFCASLASTPQCASHPGFVLHGLWPQNRDGSWPANCVNHAPGPTNPSAWLDVTPDLPLISHEWSKHGACTTLSGDDYFTLASQAYRSIAIPPLFSQLNHEVAMKPNEIVALFLRANPSLAEDSINLSCENDRLSAVEVCLSKELRPVSCTALKGCRADSIRITPKRSFGALNRLPGRGGLDPCATLEVPS